MRALIACSLASLVGKRPKASTSASVSIGAYGSARNVDLERVMWLLGDVLNSRDGRAQAR
jgi:hypothetical protein